MSSTIINLIIQLVAGIIGGNGVGAYLKECSLGGTYNAIAGAIGGVGLGQMLQAIFPALAGAGGVDVASIIGQLIGGGAGGAILTVLAGLVRNTMTNHHAPTS